MSNSSFFFLVPCERFTFLWLWEWCDRLFFNLIFNSLQRSMTRPNLKQNSNVLTLSINTCFDKNVKQTFQNLRQNYWEKELRSLFVAKEGDAFSYPANITKFCLSSSELLNYFALFQQICTGVLHNYSKIMLLGFRIIKNVPSVLKSSNSLQKC